MAFVTLALNTISVMSADFAFEKPSIQTAWRAFLQHIPVFLMVWVGSVLLTLVGVLVSLVLGLILSLALGTGADDAVFGLVAVLVQLVQLPFTMCVSLLAVLLVAVPAAYYERGEVVTASAAVSMLIERWRRYLIAGFLFSLATTIGALLCVLPGIAVALVTPIFVNRIFVTDISIGDAFSQSFQTVYRSENGWGFVGQQILVFVVAGLVALLTCGLGAILVVPVASFYIQNLAYNRGLLR